MKTVVITGASTGIGAAAALYLAKHGWCVFAGVRKQADADALSARSEGDIRPLILDVTKQDQVDAAVETVSEFLKGQTLTGLVNNAGMQHVAPVEDFPVEKWDTIIALNLTAAFHTTRLAVPAMKRKGWGRIINTASAHSKVASPFKAAYNSAKHGLDGFTKTIALELAEHGVTANCVSPGYVWTPLVESQIPDTMKARGLTREQVINDVLLVKQATKKFVQPEEIGALVAFLCRDEAQNVNGANWSVDGGWTAE